MARPRRKRAPRNGALVAAVALLRPLMPERPAEGKERVVDLLVRFSRYLGGARPLVSEDQSDTCHSDLFGRLECHCREYVQIELGRLHGRGCSFARSESLAAFFVSSLYEELVLKLESRDGVFFTPVLLAYHMAATLLQGKEARTETAALKLLDLCCGSGNLLIACLDYFTLELGTRANLQMTGVESDAGLARLARANIALAGEAGMGRAEISVANADALDFCDQADYVISNPPWTRLKVSPAGRNYQTYFEAACARLMPGGRAAILTPAAIYSDKGAEKLRRKILRDFDWQLESFVNDDESFAIHTSFKFALSLITAEQSSCPVGCEASSLRALRGVRARFNQRVESVNSFLDSTAGGGWLEYDLATIEALNSDYSLVEADDGRAFDLLKKLSVSGLPLYYFHESGAPQEDRGRYRKLRTFDRIDRLPFTLRFARDIDITMDAHRLVSVTSEQSGNVDNLLLPVLEGRQIEQFGFKSTPSRFLLDDNFSLNAVRVGFASISSATNTRSMIAAVLPALPCANSLPYLIVSAGDDSAEKWAWVLAAIFNSLIFDYTVRARMTGNNLNYFLLDQCPLPSALLDLKNRNTRERLDCLANLSSLLAAISTNRHSDEPVASVIVRVLRAVLDALVATLYNLDEADFTLLLRGSLPGDASVDRGFHRIDSHLPTVLRLPNLALLLLPTVRDDDTPAAMRHFDHTCNDKREIAKQLTDYFLERLPESIARALTRALPEPAPVR